MTKDEIQKRKTETMQAIQQGLGMIENMKGQVAAARGKVVVYDELLAEMEATDTEIPPLKAVEGEGEEAEA